MKYTTCKSQSQIYFPHITTAESENNNNSILLDVKYISQSS
jgi:hypothetical protein